MKDIYKEGLNDFFDFLSKYNLSKSVSNKDVISCLKKCNKFVFPLLIWREAIKEFPNSGFVDDDLKKYFCESVSDLCTSIFLLPHGLYKPAYLSLRTGLENAFRVFGLASGKKVLSLTSVYELIEVIKECDVVKKTDLGKAEFSKLRQSYSDLCKYVHTASDEHMSMIEALNQIHIYEKKKLDAFASEFSSVCMAVTSIITVHFFEEFKEMHHKYHDAVLAGVTPSMRKQIMC